MAPSPMLPAVQTKADVSIESLGSIVRRRSGEEKDVEANVKADADADACLIRCNQ